MFLLVQSYIPTVSIICHMSVFSVMKIFLFSLLLTCLCSLETWQQAALPPHMDSSTVFARLCQSAPHLIHASLGPLDRPNPKQHLNRFSHFCTTHHRVSLNFTMGTHPPKMPLPMKGSGHPFNTWFLGTIQLLNPDISISSAVFAGHIIVTDRQTNQLTSLLGL